MPTQYDSCSERTSRSGALRGLIVGTIVVSFIVIPGIVLGLGAYGWRSAYDISMVGFASVVMIPGVLLGFASILVMLDSAS